MSYSDYELSVHGGNAVYLVEFLQGALSWRYTSRGEDFAVLGQTWSAAPMAIGAMEQTNEMNKQAVAVTFPRDHAFAQAFIGSLQEAVTTLTIWRGHADDPATEYLAYWKGRIAGVQASGAEVTFNCESIFTSLRRPGLRARYQKSCRHTLYQRGCGLDKANFAEVCPILSSSGTGLVVGTARPDDWFTGGMVAAPDGALRFVMRQVGGTLTLSRANAELDALVASGNYGYGMNWGNYWGGLGVTAYPGCDRSNEICQSKFNNLLNQGGFRWIPLKNPFSGSSIV